MTAARPAILPFQPTGALRPLFFLHIPKTAGSALNATLGALYGVQNCQFHVEARIDAILRGDHLPLQADCVTGHLPFAKWRDSGAATTYETMTVLRDPWDRLVSHLNWMDRFNHGIDPATLPRLPKGYQAVVALLAQTDFNNPASLARFCDGVRGGAGRRLFDNLQVRMLAGSATPDTLAIEPPHVTEALATLDRFRLVGWAGDLAATVGLLAGWLCRTAATGSVDRPINPARSGRILAGNYLARAALSAFWVHDADLLDALNRRSPLPALRPDAG